MDSSSISRSNTVTRLCFIEEDDGLASLAKTEDVKPLSFRPINYNGFQRSSSLRTLPSFQSVPSSKFANGRFFHVEQHEHPPTHFLDSCFLCNKTLGDRDIFMYRGDTPFCSEECRQEQIEMDEAKEMSLHSTKALRKKEQTTSTSPNNTTQTYRFPSSTIAAA